MNTGRSNAFRNPYKYEDILLFWLLFGIVFTLPWLFCAILLLFAGLYSWLPASWRANHKYIIAVGLFIGVTFAVVTLPHLISGDSILAGITLVTVLKRAELYSVRDRLVFIVVVFLSNSLNLVYWNNVPALLHLLILVGLILGFVYRNTRFHVANEQGSYLQLVIFSIPLAVMLFLLLPRIPGPLWDVGLAFGLPISVYQQNVSFSSTKSVSENNSLTKLQAQQRVVLLAEFSGAVPLKSKLYWRGPVSYGYSNGIWIDSLKGKKRSQRLATAYKNIKRYQKLIISHEAAVHFKVKVAPHGEYWLYSPDLPLKNVQESYISKDGQLLTIRPLNDEFSYRGSSYLNAGFKPEKSPEITVSELPEQEKEQIEALATQWRTVVNKQGIKQNLLEFLANPPAWFDVKTPFSEDRLKRWVGISMLILQRAGVPARMISGYRGGDLIALSDVMIVREKHRHHWLELWSDKEGWSRIDVRDILQVRETAKELESTSKNQPDKEQQSQQPKNRDLTPAKNPFKEQGFSWLKKMENWLQSYKPQALTAALPNTSNKQSSLFKFYLWLPILFIFWFLFIILYRRFSLRITPIEKGWSQLNSQLRRHGYHLKTSQCPTYLIEQLEQRNPPWKEAAVSLINTYIMHLYSDQTMPVTQKAYLSRVKRFTLALKNIPLD